MGAGSSSDSLNNTGLQTRWMYWTDVARRAKPGDLIEFSRSFSIGYTSVPYKHWAVFVGHKDKEPYVIHYSNPVNRTSSDERTKTASWIPESVQQNDTATELFDSYIRDDKLCDIALYSQCRINNSQDYRDSPYRPAEILRRARSRMNEGGYSLYSSNCEHFARWARNGAWVSFQLSLLHGGSSMALDGPDSVLGRSLSSVHDALDYDRPHPHVPYRRKQQKEPGICYRIIEGLNQLIEAIVFIIQIILLLFIMFVILTALEKRN